MGRRRIDYSDELKYFLDARTPPPVMELPAEVRAYLARLDRDTPMFMRKAHVVNAVCKMIDADKQSLRRYIRMGIFVPDTYIRSNKNHPAFWFSSVVLMAEALDRARTHRIIRGHSLIPYLLEETEGLRESQRYFAGVSERATPVPKSAVVPAFEYGYQTYSIPYVLEE
jgi:hypothetical protein